MRRLGKILVMAFVAMLIVGTTSCVEAGNKLKYNSKSVYEVETMARGAEGTNIVRLYGKGESEEAAIEDAKMKAVACALFCGFPSGANGVTETTPAIITDEKVESTYKKFLAEFFKPQGQYLQYVKISTTAASKSKAKVSKTIYKVGISLEVAYQALKDEMIKQGLVVQ